MRKLLYLLLVLSLVSCLKKEIPFEGKDARVLLVMSSTFSTDSLMTVFLSQTKSVIGKDVETKYFSDSEASVDVYDEDGKVESLIYSEVNKAFVGSSKPFAGKTYIIKAKASGLDDVEAVITIPDLVEISNEPILEIENSDSYKNRSIRISFNDTNKKNFYRLSLYSRYDWYGPGSATTTRKFSVIPFTSKDDVFKDRNTGIDDSFDEFTNLFAVFTDDFIGSKPYSIKINLSIYDLENYDNDFKLFVSLQSISEDYYLFLKSYELQLDAGDSPFTEPVQIWSNIKGGAGIAAAYSVSTKQVIID